MNGRNKRADEGGAGTAPGGVRAPLTVFVSYSSMDDRSRTTLDIHLEPLVRRELIDVWHDRKIEPGEEWNRAIADKLETSDVVILLVSHHFLASDFCYEKEMTRALARHDASEARVIPVILSECHWRNAPFARLQVLPERTRPIKRFREKEEAWTRVTEAIEHLALSEVPIRRGAASPAALTPVKPATNAPAPREVGPAFDRNHEVETAMHRKYGRLDDVRGPACVALHGGVFKMGIASAPDATPHVVTLSPFRITRYPVTNLQYMACVQAGAAEAPEHWVLGSIPEGSEHHPVVKVTWTEAAGFAQWLTQLVRAEFGGSVSLPTEAQWEFAARGGEGRPYPWGDEAPSGRHANCEMNLGGTSEVGSFPEGATPDGIYDLAGNVSEWCRDWYGHFTETPVTNPVGSPNGAHRVVRGGNFADSAHRLQGAYRDAFVPVRRQVHVGFRVVWSESSS